MRKDCEYMNIIYSCCRLINEDESDHCILNTAKQ